MKPYRIILQIVILVLVAYGSAFYGFTSGFQFSLSFNDVEASTDVRILKMLRSNQTQQAIENMESRLNTHVISYVPANKVFGIAFPMFGEISTNKPNKFFAEVRNYRKESSYSCSEPQEICAYAEKQLEKY